MIVLIGLLWKALTAGLAVLLLRGMLIWFDGTRWGKKFKEEVMDEWSPADKSAYYRYRFVGLCLLVGLLLF